MNSTMQNRLSHHVKIHLAFAQRIRSHAFELWTQTSHYRNRLTPIRQRHLHDFCHAVQVTEGGQHACPRLQVGAEAVVEMNDVLAF